MEALSRHFRTGCPCEVLYADDLVIIAETLSELSGKFRVWKANLEYKGLRVNVGKTKILVSVHNAPKPVDGSKFPCGVCNKGVGINSIKCHACSFWVHKNLTLILNIRNVGVKYPFQTASQLLSMVKKSKKSVCFAILVISLNNVVGVSMPQQPE